MKRPPFSDLTRDQQRQFGNGVGPYWLSDRARFLITFVASWFFFSASWWHHDFGYCVGGDRWDRARCDWKFFKAMLRDAVSQPFLFAIVLTPIALFLSVLFYAAVRLGGGQGSFKYRDEIPTLNQVLEAVN